MLSQTKNILPFKNLFDKIIFLERRKVRQFFMNKVFSDSVFFFYLFIVESLSLDMCYSL